jgi:cation transport ATPase
MALMLVPVLTPCMRMQVFAGTVNCGEGALVVETSVDAAGSTVARMAALVEQVLF